MADWFVKFFSQDGGVQVGEYSMMSPEVEVRNSEPGGFSCELALGQKRRGQDPLTGLGISRDEFAPYRTLYSIGRQSSGGGVTISEGMLTSINLNFNRDTVLVSGKDWKHYLQRRIYPFTPEDYVTFNSDEPLAFWDKWPKKWVEPNGDPVDIAYIIRDLLLSMKTGKPVDHQTSPKPAATAALGVPGITWNIANTGTTARYKIYPGDQTSIYDHIQKLSEMGDGFEWDILPGSLEFKIWSPTKYEFTWPAYWFAPNEFEANGALTEFDWTNDGPDGTFLLGLGSGGKTGSKIGATWTTVKNREQFGRYDLVYDYGEIQNYETILQKLQDQNDLWPQKKLLLSLLNPEFLPLNFYTGGRPRSLVADYVRVTHDFAPLHKVDAFFQINAIKWNVDPSTNERVALELMMIYEPDDGSSGGILEPM